MCFTTSSQGQRYFQIFGVFSPPRLIETDEDHTALRALCRRYLLVFAIGTALFVFAAGFVPAFWVIITAWYYDKARTLSAKTDLPRPPFRFAERLEQRAQQQSTRAIKSSLATCIASALLALASLAAFSSNEDVVMVSAMALLLASVLSWANLVKLNAKRRADTLPAA